MPTVQSMPLPWTTVYAATTGNPKKFFVGTGWMKASQFDKIRVTFETLAFQGTLLSIQPAYQVANVQNSVLGGGTLATAATTETVVFPSGWDSIGSTTEDDQIVRFGWEVTLTAAGSLALGMVGGTLEFITN